MATTYPGINNSSNWEEFINEARTSEKLGDGSYRPIPQFVSGTTLSAKLIAVRLFSNTAPSYYKNAGWLTQTVFAGVDTGGTFRTKVDKSWFLLLDRPNLIIPSPAFPEYGVVIDIPYWYDQILVVAWQYKGPTNDFITNQLTDIDVKLDLLLGG